MKYSRISFDEVKQQFINDHPLERGSNSPAFWNLNKANEQFLGIWYYRSLTLKEVLSTVLSHHDHWQEESDIKLVPWGGLTVAQAITRYKSIKNYAETNPLCWQTLEFVKNSTTDVYLSKVPIDSPDFQPLNRFAIPGLFVLDGLHRLIGRGLVGNYGEPGLAAKPVNAFIAG